jgi:hypothetical protein
MIRRAVLLAAVAFTASCTKQADRLVTADGQVVVGKLLALESGVAEFRGFTATVPVVEARVTLRGGASYRGEVSVADGMLTVDARGGAVTARLRDVSCVAWGATGASSSLLDVPAAAGWLNTHIEVGEGMIVSLAAGGQAAFASGSSGPEGVRQQATTASLVPEALDGSLVARIGTDGPAFTVGTSWSGTADRAGELWLAVNLPDAGTPSGVYTVSVTVDQDPADGPAALYPARR